VFECDDVVGGRAVKVRFEWHAHPSAPSWKQSFSFDSGAVWKFNWVMILSRPATEHGDDAPPAMGTELSSG
jgi:hypothetical protein